MERFSSLDRDDGRCGYMQITCALCFNEGNPTTAIAYTIESGTLTVDVYLCERHAALAQNAKVRETVVEVIEEDFDFGGFGDVDKNA